MKILLLICAGLLLLGLANMPNGFYTLLRIAVTIGSIAVVIVEFEKGFNFWVLAFGLTALIFNPIIPVYLNSKSIWMPIDLLCSILFLIKSFVPKQHSNNSKTKGHLNGRYKFSFVLIFLLLCFKSSFPSISVCSWNLKDLGKSKSDIEIDFIASTVQNFDVIAIQEVVAKVGGAQAVARLVDIMNRKGNSWDYTISDPTISSSASTSERYAFIWNKSKVAKLGAAWLENHYVVEIDREPYFATFRKEGKMFTVVNFHAKPKSRQPETEIKYFKFLPALYPTLNLIFCGDFNCPQSHTVFNPLKAMGYKSAFIGQKTSLRMKCIQNDCLASEFDNFFYDPRKTIFSKSGVIHFYQSFSTLEEAREISDHIPIYLTLE